MVLKDIPANARPREKLLAHGPSALADAELMDPLSGNSVLNGIPVTVEALVPVNA